MVLDIPIHHFYIELGLGFRDEKTFKKKKHRNSSLGTERERERETALNATARVVVVRHTNS
jgi:hypothetical protein